MKAEKINKLYFRDIDKPLSPDRREFLKKLGGGIIIIFSIGEMGILNGCSNGKEDSEEDFNAYLRIKEDGRVDCFTGKIEMGQGVITSIAQVLADELDVPLGQVDMVMGDTELCPYDEGTWGSMTTRFFDPVLRAAAAEARMVLVELAAEYLKVNKDQLGTLDGSVIVTDDPQKKVDYVTLTKGQKIVRKLSGKAKPKTPDQFKIKSRLKDRLAVAEKRAETLANAGFSACGQPLKCQ